MSSNNPSPPDPPGELPEAVVGTIQDCSADTLEALANYAEELATFRREQQGGSDENEKTEKDARAADRPDGVPAKASTTVKEINGNRYHYWQWRDGESIRSQYKGPVTRNDDS